MQVLLLLLQAGNIYITVSRVSILQKYVYKVFICTLYLIMVGTAYHKTVTIKYQVMGLSASSVPTTLVSASNMKYTGNTVRIK